MKKASVIEADKSKVKAFVEGLKDGKGPQRELLFAFMSYISEQTDKFSNNIAQFVSRNQDIVAATGFSMVCAASFRVDKELPIMAAIGASPEETLVKALTAVAKLKAERAYNKARDEWDDEEEEDDE